MFRTYHSNLTRYEHHVVHDSVFSFEGIINTNYSIADALHDISRRVLFSSVMDRTQTRRLCLWMPGGTGFAPATLSAPGFGQ